MPESSRTRLEGAAAGLVYTSEGDAPFEYVELASLAPESLRAHAGAAPDARVEEVTLDRFFAGHIEESDPADPAAQALRERYTALRQTLRDTLEGVRGFRVGQVEIRCYLAGRTPEGTLAGLATTAWES